jgi:ribonuclease P protein component
LKQFSLGKNERLKSRKQIEFLFKEGKTFSIAPLKVYYSFTKTGDNVAISLLQFGAGVSSKHFKKAPHRNRIKRLLREAYRTQKNQLKETLQLEQLSLTVFFIFTGRDLPNYQLIADKTGTVLQKLSKLAHETTIQQ